MKEDVKHLLKELWGVEETDALDGIFTKESRRGTQCILRYSKEELKDLSCVEDDGTVLRLAEHEIGGICMLVLYQQHLLVNGLSPEDITSFRFNSITFKDYSTFSTAKGLEIKGANRNEFDSASFSSPSKESSNHKKPTLKTLFRSALKSGSKSNNGLLKNTLKNDD